MTIFDGVWIAGEVVVVGAVAVVVVVNVVVFVMGAGERGEIGASFARASETSPQNPLIVNLPGALPPTLLR